jgi:hypothetical protein
MEYEANERSLAVTSHTAVAILLQWASETGAHGMPVPQELERMGWLRRAEHPLFQGTWLMETAESGPDAPAPPVLVPHPVSPRPAKTR